jgi:PAS domain S-box-containing protein
VEHRIVQRNGSIHWIRTRSSTQFEGEGSLSHPVRTVGAVVDITEQKQAEEELRKGKEQYHTILQTALDGFWVLDLQGHFIDVNEAYCKIIGYSREELLGMTIRDVELLETESETRQRIQKIIGNGYDFFETRHSRKDGQIVDIEASVNYLPNEAKLFVFVRDITERKQVELEREQFLKFFQLSSDIMVIADPNGCFKKVNPACLQILGYSETELLAKPFVDFVHPDDRQLTLDEMARQIKLGFSLKFENRFLCKDSTVRWLSWSANYKKDEGITYATARDITERKQAEDELLKSKFLLNETQNISKVGGWEYDVITGKMTWTEETYRIYGVTPSDYDPNNINHDIEFYVNGDKVIIEHAFKKAVEMGEAYDLELKFRNAYGNKVWVRTIGIPEYKDGRVIRVHGYLMDITERKRAQDERIQLLEREHEARTEAEAAKKLDRMKSMFIASTSHELRTPLNSVIGFSSLLLEGYSGQLTPEQKEQIEIVHSSGKHLLSLINDIIDISQIEAGNIKVEVCEFNLRQVVDEVVLMLKVSISEKKLDMKVNMQDIEMRSDRRLMFQCIVNLLSNAIKYTEKGSVAISAKVINNNVIITVVDTGIGIKTEDIPRLFGPFVRLQSPLTYKTSGTGLGLYLVKKVAKDFLGGDVEVESEVGKGSTFTLCVPVELERKV